MMTWDWMSSFEEFLLNYKIQASKFNQSMKNIDQSLCFV